MSTLFPAHSPIILAILANFLKDLRLNTITLASLSMFSMSSRKRVSSDLCAALYPISFTYARACKPDTNAIPST